MARETGDYDSYPALTVWFHIKGDDPLAHIRQPNAVLGALSVAREYDDWSRNHAEAAALSGQDLYALTASQLASAGDLGRVQADEATTLGTARYG